MTPQFDKFYFQTIEEMAMISPDKLREKTGEMVMIREKEIDEDCVDISINILRNNRSIVQASIDSATTGIYNMHIMTHDKDNIGHGYGTLVYDVAMEYISNYKSGIMAPSIAVGYHTKPNAQNIYKYYFYKRDDVIKHNIDKYIIKKTDEYPVKDNPWLYTGYTKPLKVIPELLSRKLLTINR